MIGRYSRTAAQTGEMFEDYFCSISGELEWQNQYVR